MTEVDTQGIKPAEVKFNIEADMVDITDLLPIVYKEFKKGVISKKYESLHDMYFRIITKSIDDIESLTKDERVYYWNKALNPEYDNKTLEAIMNYIRVLKQNDFFRLRGRRAHLLEVGDIPPEKKKKKNRKRLLS